jgi:hypothetical protein
MVIFAYDHQGIFMKDRIPCGTSATAAYYRDGMKNCEENAQKPI